LESKNGPGGEQERKFIQKKKNRALTKKVEGTFIPRQLSGRKKKKKKIKIKGKKGGDTRTRKGSSSKYTLAPVVAEVLAPGGKKKKKQVCKGDRGC